MFRYHMDGKETVEKFKDRKFISEEDYNDMVLGVFFPSNMIIKLGKEIGDKTPLFFTLILSMYNVIYSKIDFLNLRNSGSSMPVTIPTSNFPLGANLCTFAFPLLKLLMSARITLGLNSLFCLGYIFIIVAKSYINRHKCLLLLP